MNNLPVLVAFTTAVVELIKALFKAFNLFTTDEQREVVIRVVAVAVGIGVALAFQYDALNPDAPTLAGIVVSGALLALGSDLVHVGIDVGKKVATPNPPGTSVTVETTGAGGTATASASSPPSEPPTSLDDTASFPPYRGNLPH